MKVNVSFPKNYLQLHPREQYLFAEKKNYHTCLLNIKSVQNVFVTHEGLVLKNGLLVTKSAFNLKGSADQTFYFSFWKLAFEQYLVSTFGKSLKKIELSQGEYLHIYSKWFGYFFWLTDCLPKLIKTQNQHSHLQLIYPESWRNFPFVNQTLELFSSLNLRIIPSGIHMQVHNLLLPETRAWSNAIDPEEIKLVREFISQKVKEKNIDLNLGDKIYISRKKALRRKPVNENELELFLENKGFKAICLEDFTFLEQASIMRNAKTVIGIHGAGLANIMFMPSGGHLIELSPEINESELFRIPFWRLASAINCDYSILFCKMEKIMQDQYDSDILVDLSALEKLIFC